MLYEFFQHLTTPCPRPVKDMGYLRELIGMQARYKRCQAAWQPHLHQCRNWICQAMQGSRGRVVVLGSGLLYDVPLQELSDHFDEVVLVDILHMPTVRKAIRPFSNVSLETRDITGFVEALHDGTSRTPPEAPDIAPGGADLVISLNVLSQLPILPMAFAGLEATVAPSLMQAHLEALQRSAAKICLISEVEQQLCLDGEVVEKDDPLAGVSIPQNLKVHTADWRWDFAPHPERHRRYDLVYRVEGYLR
ncbi:MAG: hypothetical protein H8E36_03210 [Rhodospirillaceae bacterium]|nr:hypothetical protein [Rhodospirillaceae bacterium]